MTVSDRACLAPHEAWITVTLRARSLLFRPGERLQEGPDDAHMV